MYMKLQSADITVPKEFSRVPKSVGPAGEFLSKDKLAKGFLLRDRSGRAQGAPLLYSPLQDSTPGYILLCGLHGFNDSN